MLNQQLCNFTER